MCVKFIFLGDLAPGLSFEMFRQFKKINQWGGK